MILNIPVSIDEDALKQAITEEIKSYTRNRVDKVVNDELKKDYYNRDNDPVTKIAKQITREVIESGWDSIESEVVKELAKNLSRTKKARELLDEVAKKPTPGEAE